MFWKAVKTSAWLGVLFLVVYNGANYLTSLRQGVGTWVFAWERFIPFVPIFIIPYMSIDLFFMAGPFLCRSDEERRILARRITAAILIGGAFFLIHPLRLATERPHVEGWLGAIFNPFCAVDKPFNLLPSLHITLRTLLADLYARHSRGALRWASHLWFSAIGFSTLLVHQHHVVDVIGGFLLAMACFYLFRTAPLRLAVRPNRRIGTMYAAGAFAVVMLALALRPWGLWLLWPAAALALTAAGYFFWGAGIYGKSAGRLPLAARLVMAPVLAGQALSLRHYARRARRWDELTSTIWIGRLLSDAEAREAIAAGVTAVVDLTGEFSEAVPFLDGAYLNLPVLDLTAPTPEQVGQALRFIEQQSARGIVYVHCKIGYSRTAVIAGAWLMHRGLVQTAEEAMARLRAARPTIVIRPEAAAAIQLSHFATVPRTAQTRPPCPAG